jgi:hypothetical protein
MKAENVKRWVTKENEPFKSTYFHFKKRDLILLSTLMYYSISLQVYYKCTLQNAHVDRNKLWKTLKNWVLFDGLCIISADL